MCSFFIEHADEQIGVVINNLGHLAATKKPDKIMISIKIINYLLAKIHFHALRIDYETRYWSSYA